MGVFAERLIALLSSTDHTLNFITGFLSRAIELLHERFAKLKKTVKIEKFQTFEVFVF